LLRRAALAVDRHAGDIFWESGGQPRGARDIPCLWAYLVDASEDDIFDGVRVDARPFHEGFEDVRAQVCRMDL